MSLQALVTESARGISQGASEVVLCLIETLYLDASASGKDNEMAGTELTASESALLIVLMAEAQELSNTDLRNRFHISLTGKSREKLNRLGLVASRKIGNTFFHQLDDKGWVRVHQELNFDSPKARALGAALSSLHGNLISRALPRLDRNFGEVFTLAAAPLARELGALQLEARIRHAYANLAKKPGGWVSLAALRRMLVDAMNEDVSAALQRMAQSADVNVVPESNQKSLTDEDRRSAVRVGEQDKHLLSIEV